MIDPKLIQEWYYAAHDEIKSINLAYSQNQCKIDIFESGNHYSMISIKIDDTGLTVSFRIGSSRFWEYIGTTNFPATTFLEIVNMVNGEIEKRWKFLEDYLEQQRKAAADMDTILRKQISSWRLLGKDVKPP